MLSVSRRVALTFKGRQAAYWQGRVTGLEMLLLQGLPRPPYNRNSVQVDSEPIRHGRKVLLAAILDTLRPCGGPFVWPGITRHLCQHVSKNHRGLLLAFEPNGDTFIRYFKLKISQEALVSLVRLLRLSVTGCRTTGTWWTFRAEPIQDGCHRWATSNTKNPRISDSFTDAELKFGVDVAESHPQDVLWVPTYLLRSHRSAFPNWEGSSYEKWNIISYIKAHAQ